MPTTRAKNIIYRAALPFKAPRLPRNTDFSAEGHIFLSGGDYSRLLRRHRVLGSACLVTCRSDSLLLLSSTDTPKHTSARNTMFRVASITKMATALAVLSLCEKGLLDLNGPLTGFFPGEKFSPAAARITPSMLLSHTGGLSDPPDLEACLHDGKSFPAFLDQCISTEPGKVFHYSNLGFGLLGCIMEAVTGKAVSHAVEDEVFHPLGMQATLDASTLDSSLIMPVCRVLPYHPDREVIITKLGKVPLKGPDPLRHYGHSAGSMYTDIESLNRMMLCLRDGGAPLLSRASGENMRGIHASYGQRSPTLSYGLGLLIIRDSSLSKSRILGHQGYAYGCADGAFWEEDTGNIILFLNGGCSEERLGMLGRCNYDILKLFLRKELPQWHSSVKS